MNILFCGFNLAWHEKIVQGISDFIEPEHCVVISCYTHHLDNANVNQYDFNDLSYSEFKKIDLEMLPPLDTDLIYSMFDAEHIFMTMMDRLEIKIGKNYSYRDRLNIYYDSLRVVNGILMVHKVDACFFDYIPHLGFDYLLYKLCKLKKIKIVMQCYGLSLPYITTSRYFLNDICNPIPALSDLKVSQDMPKLSERMCAYLTYYGRQNKYIKSFVSDSIYLTHRHVYWNKIKTAIRLLLRRDSHFFAILRQKNKLRASRKAALIYSEKCTIPPRYLYFPLQYQPECTTVPQGGVFGNQELIVQMISSILPSDVYLLLKPHPNTSFLADKKFYQRLTNFRNTKLIRSEQDTYQLIDNSLAVVTVTGTVGWESITRSVPVLMFGYSFYQYAPLVYHINSIEECQKALAAVITKKTQFDKKQMVAYLNELDKYLIEGFMEDFYINICDLDMMTNIKNTIHGYLSFLNNEKNWKM